MSAVECSKRLCRHGRCHIAASSLHLRHRAPMISARRFGRGPADRPPDALRFGTQPVPAGSNAGSAPRTPATPPTTTRSVAATRRWRPVGGRPALHADGQRLVDVLGHGQDLRHGLEGPAHVVLVEAGHDHAHAAVGERRSPPARARRRRTAPRRCRRPPCGRSTLLAGSRRASATTCDGIFMSRVADDVVGRRSGRRSRGLKICTFWRAIWARRTRRMSSSLLPLNMLPVIDLDPARCPGA